MALDLGVIGAACIILLAVGLGRFMRVGHGPDPQGGIEDIARSVGMRDWENDQ